jgi:hypothetical protein
MYSSSALRSTSYRPATCTLTESIVIKVNGPAVCLHDRYLAVWKSTQSYTILESPLTSSVSQQYAQSLLDNYPMNTPVECVCDNSVQLTYPNFEKSVPCNFYGRCFLNVEIVNYIKSQSYFNSVGDALIIVGVIAMALIIMAAVITVLCNRSKHVQYIDLTASKEEVKV